MRDTVVAVAAMVATFAAAQAAPDDTVLRERVARAIRRVSFACPVITAVDPRGTDEFGDIYKVTCAPGPDGKAPDFPAFRVTLKPDDSGVKVRPWKD